MVEQTEETNGSVMFRAQAEAGSNIFRKGEDARKGDILLRKGTPLGALQIGVCAAVGKAQVKVRCRPRVAVLCTGEELRGVSDRVCRHEARNSNGPALCAALDTWGYAGVTHHTAPDDVKTLTSKLKRVSAKHDVILLTGGVSVGKYDLVREAVERIGAVVRFHGVAMKPGKPLLYTTLSGNRHIFGLPGNPLSAMTGFYEFALPALRRMSGVAAQGCRSSLNVTLASGLVSKGGRVRFMLARLLWGPNGPRAEPVKSRSSADLVAGGRADGVIAVPADVRKLAAGTLVEFRPWKPLP
jgi:molybdopterin molybdotransferase